MRFVLDNDVDASVRRVLVSAGHEAWTLDQAGLAGHQSTPDDDVSVYADDRDAALITHDREFTKRRRRNTFGWHVWLNAPQPDGRDLVERHLEQVVEILEARQHIVVEVTWEEVKEHPPHWK